MTDQLEAVKERIKRDVLPALFIDPDRIGAYGQATAGADKDGVSRIDPMAELSALLEEAPVTRLASLLGDIVTKLAEADPKKLTKQPTRIQRFLGAGVEVRVRYQAARATLDTMIVDAAVHAQSVRDAVTKLDALTASYGSEVLTLRAHIDAGREYLAENPDAGRPRAGGKDFENVRERFARKLANMATLFASHEMSQTQMALTRAQAVDMLDRFDQTTTVLVPVWRQHTLALASSKNLDPMMLKSATKAHEALMRSLSDSLAELS